MQTMKNLPLIFLMLLAAQNNRPLFPKLPFPLWKSWQGTRLYWSRKFKR